MLLSDKYPFLTQYFETALNNDVRPLPQTILFYGNDLDAQYLLAKEVARLLNCQKEKADNCDCINCKWIREDAHPAVMTISRCDNKPEDDDSKKVISVKQSAMIKEQLVSSSEFHRVYIFCDKDDENKVCGLNKDNFQAETANSLLKIIEEPQPGVTFIFLTRYIEDLLPTIISRSQCFFVPSLEVIDYDYSIISGVFDNFWQFDRKNVFDVSQNLQNLANEHSVLEVLSAIQCYILSVLKTNNTVVDFIEQIGILENAIKQYKLGIKSNNIFDDVCLKLIK